MFSRDRARQSVDTLASPTPSPSSPPSARPDFPFPRQSSRTSLQTLSQSHSHQRRSSTASSIHSIGGALDSSSVLTSSSSNPLQEVSQNAISTLLQPPIVRTGLLPHTAASAGSGHKPPTARDIPPVALTNIPHVEASEFRPYLEKVGPLYELLRRVRESEHDEAGGAGNGGGGDGERRGSKGSRSRDGSETPVDENHLKAPGRKGAERRKASTSSISSSWAQIEPPTPVRRSSTGLSRRGGQQGPPPLTTIPNVYFEDDFRLENPRTFDVVSERSEVVRPPAGSEDRAHPNGTAAAPRKALATNAILQEKLSWYMDTIEMHLIVSISTASTTFFSALGSLRELHSEAADSVDRIKALRRQLTELDEEVAMSGLEIVHKKRRLENVRQLHAAVVQLREVADGVAASEALVDAGEAEKALDSLDGLERLVAGEVVANNDSSPARQLMDLRGATALQGLPGDIEALRYRVGKSFEAKLTNALVADLRDHVKTVSKQEVLMRWSSASMRSRGGHNREPSAFPTYMASTDDLRSQLLGNLTGLQRAKHLAAATSAYREAVIREVKAIIRRPLPSSADDDNESVISSSTAGTAGRQRSQQEKSSTLARNLRAMDPGDAEELLSTIYIGVTETLRRLTTQAKVMLDVASQIGQDDLPSGMKSPPLKSPPLSPARRASVAALQAQEEIHATLDLANLLGQAVDIAHDKIVKLLRVRAEQSTGLPLTWFLRYFTINRLFANECESISGRSGTNLKTVVNGHIKEFVQRHGTAEKKSLAQGMESDKWEATNFGGQESDMLQQVLESSTRDPAAWLDGTKVWLPYADVDDDNNEAPSGAAEGVAQTNGTSSKTSKATIRNATIEGETFVLPNSAILCLRGMTHFLHLTAGIPPMTIDVATSLISYLQLFNSRCTQLILGAGATKSAGLKNITTKHLALASQALNFIATLITHVREFIRRQAGTGGQALANLMGEFDKARRLFQEHQNSIYDKLVEIMGGRVAAHAKALRNVDWDGDGVTAPHAYVDVLVRETTQLHRNLVKVLPETTIRVIMAPVFRNYGEVLRGALGDVGDVTETGKERFAHHYLRLKTNKLLTTHDSLLRDMESLYARLGKIDGFDMIGDSLVELVKAKPVKVPEPPAPPAVEAAKQAEPEAAAKDLTDAEKEAAEGDGKDEKTTPVSEGQAIESEGGREGKQSETPSAAKEAETS
jgi:vacuolar protein sorting-associated protein 54